MDSSYLRQLRKTSARSMSGRSLRKGSSLSHSPSLRSDTTLIGPGRKSANGSDWSTNAHRCRSGRQCGGGGLHYLRNCVGTDSRDQREVCKRDQSIPRSHDHIKPVIIAAPLIGLSAGIGEELLFRGAIQPRYGIFLTSVLFALLHSQYGFSFITLGTFLLGCIFGVIAKRYGTTHAIIAHTSYNTLAVIIAALAD